MNHADPPPHLSQCSVGGSDDDDFFLFSLGEKNLDSERESYSYNNHNDDDDGDEQPSRARNLKHF